MAGIETAHLTSAGVAGCGRGQRVVDAADASGMPLFAGWREPPRPDDAPARAAHVMENASRDTNGR